MEKLTVPTHVEPMKLEATEARALADLKALGWTVTQMARQGRDLIVSLVRGDREGQLQVIWAKGDSSHAPSFIRFDNGMPGSDVDWWERWEEIAGLIESDDPDSPRYHQTYQAAAGAEWTSVGLGIYPVLPSTAARLAALQRFMWLVAKSGPLDRDALVREATRRACRPEVAERVAFAVVAVALVSAAVVGLVLGPIMVYSLLKRSDYFAAFGASLFMLLLVAPAGVLAVVLRRSRRRKGIERWNEALSSATSRALLGEVLRGPSSHRLFLAIVQFLGDEAEQRSVEVFREKASFKSPCTPVRGSLELNLVEWGRRTRKGCCIVPGEYAVVRVKGPDALLEKLPKGPREDRSRGGVAWTVTLEEWEPLMSGAARALGVYAQQPYR